MEEPLVCVFLTLTAAFWNALLLASFCTMILASEEAGGEGGSGGCQNRLPVVLSMAKKVRLSGSGTSPGRAGECHRHSNGIHPVKNSLVGEEVDDLANWGVDVCRCMQCSGRGEGDCQMSKSVWHANEEPYEITVRCDERQVEECADR